MRRRFFYSPLVLLILLLIHSGHWIGLGFTSCSFTRITPAASLVCRLHFLHFSLGEIHLIRYQNVLRGLHVHVLTHGRSFSNWKPTETAFYGRLKNGGGGGGGSQDRGLPVLLQVSCIYENEWMTVKEQLKRAVLLILQGILVWRGIECCDAWVMSRSVFHLYLV